MPCIRGHLQSCPDTNPVDEPKKTNPEQARTRSGRKRSVVTTQLKLRPFETVLCDRRIDLLGVDLELRESFLRALGVELAVTRQP